MCSMNEYVDSWDNINVVHSTRPAKGDDMNAPLTLSEAVEKGIKCEIKDVFYVESDKPHERGVFCWVDEKPLAVEGTTKTQAERETYAILDFKKYDVVDNKWFTSRICVNNLKIQVVLAKVLEGYPGLTEHEMSHFTPPFLPFFHRWTEFTKRTKEETDEETFHYLDLLRKMLLVKLEDTFQRWADIKRTGHILFTDLLLAFDPGAVAVYVENGIRSAGIMRKGAILERNMCPDLFEAEVDVVDWNGQECGLLSRKLRIQEYDGLRAFTALEVAPLNSFVDKDTIRKDLISRGRIFENLRGQYFLAYTDKFKERANERTVIDARAFHKSQCELVPGVSVPAYRNLSEIGRLSWAQSMNRNSTEAQETYSIHPRRRGTGGRPPPRYISSAPPHAYYPTNDLGSEEVDELATEVDLSPLTEDECLLCVPTVLGFNLETKRWGKYKGDPYSVAFSISWDVRAFDNLVLNGEEKDLLLALVDREFMSDVFDDFISGKGQGMILLLSGPPGVGKTFTAESIAEHLRRPLYKVSAGELGIVAHIVENNLKTALKLCSDWNAVCLIDEADVFMATRTVDNLHRNELVSVFLRLLEYHSGIVVLTTNRLNMLDPAFKSRIDLTLMYSSLTEADRKQAWKNFLRNVDAQQVDIDESALVELAKWDFNGRQIKSAVKTARILAAKKKQPLNAKHLEVVLNLRRKSLDLIGREKANSSTEEVALNGGMNGTNCTW